MSDEVLIKHRFISTKPDSPDTTIASSSEWNDSAVLSAGVHGDFLVRDTTKPNGAGWVFGQRVTGASGTFAGASPSTNIAPITIVTNSPSSGLVFATVSQANGTSVSSVATLYQNGVPVASIVCANNAVVTLVAPVSLASPGSYTFFVSIATTGNVAITSSAVNIAAMIFGTV
jgi:hypothetical protein